MEIKILVRVVQNVKLLKKLPVKLLKDNCIDANITKVDDIVEIMKSTS